MPFTIAIIGRPNVGKSTLFNKLAGKDLAIVDNTAGVTRDRREAFGSLGPLEFNIVDTAGLEKDIEEERLESRMLRQTEMAVYSADLCLFVVDGRAGLNSLDMHFAQWLRKKNVKVVLVVNKCEDLNISDYASEYYKLGFGEPVAISAEHKLGFTYLYDAIEPFYDEYQSKIQNLEVNEKGIDVDKEIEKPIQIAIVGRPNAGKSTLVNTLLGEERVITGAEAGITRDSIAVDWEYNGKKIKLVDTAGIRKKMKVYKNLEKFSVEDSFRTIRFAHIVILMIDATSPLDKQDLSIASGVIKEGRGLVFALNKWDLVEDKQKLINGLIHEIDTNFSDAKGMQIIPISAAHGTNIDKLMKACFSVYNSWNVHISTSKLNNWLRAIEEENTPPLYKGKVTRLKYITQAKKRPPTFVLFTNNPDGLEKTSYDRFIINSLKRDFKIQDIVVRLLLRKAENPFEEKAKQRVKKDKDLKRGPIRNIKKKNK